MTPSFGCCGAIPVVSTVTIVVLVEVIPWIVAFLAAASQSVVARLFANFANMLVLSISFEANALVEILTNWSLLVIMSKTLVRSEPGGSIFWF